MYTIFYPDGTPSHCTEVYAVFDIFFETLTPQDQITYGTFYDNATESEAKEWLESFGFSFEEGA